MHKSFILFFFLFIPFLAFSQTVTEKLIVDMSSLQDVELYSLSVDSASGTYLYSYYDTTTKKSKVYSNKGNSDIFDNINYNNAIFDADGNYYAIAWNNITDTTFTYFILKNGNEIAKYNNINTSWKEKNGMIYFVCFEDTKAYMAVYSISNGHISKGKPYDDIFLCNYLNHLGDDEPEGEIGFTKDGDPFYIAKLNDEKFVVTGNEEQKHFTDIDAFYFTQDNNGNFLFPAKSKGEISDAGNALVVQGNKEYKTYDYIYGPILLDKSNNPIYISADSLSDGSYPQRVVVGDKEGKTYKGGVANLTLSPNGKLAYSATDYRTNGDSYSMVVLDGKESKRYYSISTLKFTNNDELLFTAGKDEENSCIVRGNNEIDVDYPSIIDVNVLPDGKITYACGEYGNYEKKIKDVFYLYIGDDSFGPYDAILPVNYANNQYLLYDKSGNYVYLVQKITDIKNYTYSQVLYTNKGKSSEFDYIDNPVLYKGRTLFIGSHNVPNSPTYASTSRIYYDNKPISPEYDGISNFQFDEANGIASYTIIKNKAFYKVEIKM
jgi:hypothetical protein